MAVSKTMPQEEPSLTELEELETVDVNRARNAVITAFRIFDHHDLLTCADTVLTLIKCVPEKPLAKYKDAELRELLITRAEILYRQEPQGLITLQNFVDPIARAKILRSQSKRSKIA
jgi:hypothetical protein